MNEAGHRSGDGGLQKQSQLQTHGLQPLSAACGSACRALRCNMCVVAQCICCGFHVPLRQQQQQALML